MKNIYYNFWVKVIINAKKNKSEGEVWKFPLFVVITAINSLNLFVLNLCLRILNIDIFSRMNFFNITPGTIMNNVMIFILEYSLPFILLNYFLIFYKNRYVILIEKYPPDNSKFPVIYVIISIVSCFVSLICYSIFM